MLRHLTHLRKSWRMLDGSSRYIITGILFSGHATLLFMLLELLLIVFPSLARFQQEKRTQDDDDTVKDKERRFEVHRFGVWELAILSEKSIFTHLLEFNFPTRNDIIKYLDGYYQYFPYIIRFYTEIYHLAPRYLLMYAFRNLWDSLESGLSLYCTSRLLEVVSPSLDLTRFPSLSLLLKIGDRVQGKDVTRIDVIWAILLRFLCTFTSNVISRSMCVSLSPTKLPITNSEPS